MFIPSDKQLQILAAEQSPGKHIVCTGSMRSGKTAAALRGFLWWAWRDHDNALFAVCAKSRPLLNAVIKREVQEWCAGLELPARLQGELWTIPNQRGGVNQFQPVIFAEGDNPVARIQGPTYQGTFGDEVVNMQDDFRRMLISRASPPGAKCWWTTNPDDERHPVKLELIDPILRGELTGVVIECRPADNPAVGADYYADLEINYPHKWQQDRFINGLWTSASGRVYPNCTKPHTDGGNLKPYNPSTPPFQLTAGVDWASKSVSHAVLVAHNKTGSHVIDEWRWDAEQHGPISEDEQAQRMHDQFTAHGSVARWTVDQSSKGLIHALGQIAGGQILPSQMKVNDGVARVATLFNHRLLMIDDSECPALVTELANYKWPDKQISTTVKPVKKDDHGCDALRYWAETIRMPTVKRQRSRGSGSAAA